MLNFVIIFVTLRIAQGAKCGDGICATSAGCGCKTDNTNDCSDSATPLATTVEDTVYTVQHCVSGSASNDPLPRELYFPGEEFTPGSDTVCTVKSRKKYEDLESTDNANVLPLADNSAKLVTTGTLKICGRADDNTVDALEKTVTVAHVADSSTNVVSGTPTTAVNCISQVITNERVTEKDSNGGKICDRYYDLAYNADTANTHSFINPADRIANGAPSTTTAFRCVAKNKQTAANQKGSLNCIHTATLTYICAAGLHTATGTNPTTDATRCIPSTDVLNGATVEASERAVGVLNKYGIGHNYFGKADTNSAEDWGTAAGKSEDPTKFTLNIQATAKNKLFILTTKILAHGAVSTAAFVTAGTNICLSKNAAEVACADKFICNAGGGGTNTGTVCIDHKLLLGDNAAGWSKAKQVRQPGSGAVGSEKLCLATSGTAAPYTYWVKGCLSTPAADKEVCNPNATTLADTCIKESTTLAHGEFWVKAVTPATATSAPAKNTCIGDTHYSTGGTEGQVCNYGGTDVDPKVFITAGKTKTTFEYLLSGSDTVADKTVVQGADGDLLKYCFNNGGASGENHAIICKKEVVDDTKDPPKVTTEQEVCNIYGTKATADAAAPQNQVCIEKRQLVPTGHGHVLDADNIDKKTTTKVEEIVCLGVDGADSNKTLGYKCDAKAGKFYKGDTILPAWETVVAAGEVGEDKKRCWGTVVGGSANCEAGELCNSSGTTSAGYTDLSDAVVTEICIKAEDFAAAKNGLCKKSTPANDGTDVVTYCAPATTAAPSRRRLQDETDAGNKDYCDGETGLCVAVDPTIVVDSTVTPEGETIDGTNTLNSGIVMLFVAALSV